MSGVSMPFAPAATGVKRARPSGRIGALLLGGAIVGSIGGLAAVGGRGGDVVAFVAILILIAVWLRPQLAPVLMISTGLAIEQFPLGLTNGSVEVNVPITNSIPYYTGLGPIHLEPSDLLPFLLLGIYMVRSASTEGRWWPRSQLSFAVLVVFAFMLITEFIGVGLHKGTIRESLFECRPILYMAVGYLLTSVALRTRGAVQAMLWAFTIVEPFKALQGTYVWFVTRSWTGPDKPQNVLGHEEAMFFTIFFLMVAALWLFGVRGRLRKVATWLTPLVLWGDLINDRRAAWLVLGAGLVVLVVVGYQALPEKRRAIRWTTLITAVIFAAYLGAFWNNTAGTLGSPADAIKSQFTPTPRDALSDIYRIDEDANLKYNIKLDGPLGEGYGNQIDYALPMPGLVTAGDSGIMYVPHNGVLYILMRMGILGAAAWWALIGAGIIAGCRVARSRNREFAAIGAMIAGALVGYAIEGATDMGFTFPRIAVVMGCLYGLLEAIRHIDGTTRRTQRAAPSVDTQTRKKSLAKVVA
jgi:hypothetical protein